MVARVVLEKIDWSGKVYGIKLLDLGIPRSE
jgi:hypothetical protein